ncbi:MAG: hypothetical protein ACRDXE_08415 [Acidimicrobiales bacterium]
MPDHITPDDATEAEEAEEAHKDAEPGRQPTSSEAAEADKNTVSPGVAEAEKEANERGAHVRGEGELP